MSLAQGSKKRSFQRSKRIPAEAPFGRVKTLQVEEHELTGVEAETLFARGGFDRTAEGH